MAKNTQTFTARKEKFNYTHYINLLSKNLSTLPPMQKKIQKLSTHHNVPRLLLLFTSEDFVAWDKKLHNVLLWYTVKYLTCALTFVFIDTGIKPLSYINRSSQLNVRYLSQWDYCTGSRSIYLICFTMYLHYYSTI